MTVVNGLKRFVRNWVCSGYDWPLHKDWLAWVGVALTIVALIHGVQREGGWGALPALWAFPWTGWLLGAIRAFVRGWRGEGSARRAAGTSPE